MSTPHDKLFKVVFAEPEALLALLRHALPPDLTPLLDRAALRLIDPVVPAEPGERRFDLLAELTLDDRAWTVAVLFEHQSHVDRAMGLRVLHGMLARWQQTHVQRAGGARLQRIIAVVVYHGPEPWTDPVAFHQRYEPPGPERHPFDDYQPDFRYVLLDLNDPAQRPATGPVLALLATALFARWSRIARGEPGSMLDELRAGGHLVRRLLTERDQAAFAAIVEYILRVEETATVEDVQSAVQAITQDSEIRMPTIAEQLEQRGFERGSVIGEARGIAQGLVQGEAAGLRKALLLAGTAAFGPCPPRLERRVAEAEVSDLLSTLQLLPRASGWIDLLKEL
jgi:hypothetical protein